MKKNSVEDKEMSKFLAKYEKNKKILIELAHEIIALDEICKDENIRLSGLPGYRTMPVDMDYLKLLIDGIAEDLDKASTITNMVLKK
ncbi:MAG TPA: hypothetical protein DET40_21805 [Lentisphaeria bacterium]|nr:MAG: hypothetical protein A2X45_14170 [Lentisphaerae bacterium GWF2_50_93]HCE46189.1 hypothetical protein [Lentisphaeria bacterium]